MLVTTIKSDTGKHLQFLQCLMFLNQQSTFNGYCSPQPSLLSRTNSSQPADPRQETQKFNNRKIMQSFGMSHDIECLIKTFVWKIYVNIWFQAGLPPNWWQLAKDNQTKVIQQNYELNCMLNSSQK